MSEIEQFLELAELIKKGNFEVTMSADSITKLAKEITGQREQNQQLKDVLAEILSCPSKLIEGSSPPDPAIFSFRIGFDKIANARRVLQGSGWVLKIREAK